ncbi:MAG TPA: hypothetical protein VHT34_08855 [Clostridia bacterium]|nr:hypothetical protein [Clostridia bacterium]
MRMDWGNIVDYILNMVLVSMPEEIFLVVFCLILLKQFDFLGSKNDGESRLKWRDIFEVSIPVVILAVLSRSLTQINIDPNFKLVIIIFLMPILIIIVYKLWSVEDILKTFACSFISIIVFLLIEFLYVSLVLFFTKKPSLDINGNALMSFIWSLPERMVEYVIIAFLLIRKATFLKANITKIIMKNKMLKVVFSVLLMFNTGIFVLFGKILLFSNALRELDNSVQLAVIGAITLFPIVNVTGILWAVYYVYNKEQYDKYITKESLKDMTKELVDLTQNENYNKINVVVKDIQISIEELYRE